MDDDNTTVDRSSSTSSGGGDADILITGADRMLLSRVRKAEHEQTRLQNTLTELEKSKSVIESKLDKYIVS